MSNSIVAAIYRYVIDDVVRNVQPDFEGHGVDNSVLEQLQRSWETKIIQSRVASFPGEEAHVAAADYAAAAADHMHAPSDYAASSLDHRTNMAAPPNINSAASLASIMNNDSMAPSAASLASLAQSGRGQLMDDDDDVADGAHDSQIPYTRHIPQNDGSADTPSAPWPSDTENALAQWRALRDARRRAIVAQLDGADDSEDDSPANPSTPPTAATTTAIAPTETEAQEDLINSDLDDTDEDDYENGGAEDIEHIILCQYEKVTRTRNRWKCVLRDGIMLINGRDYLFQKATGEFEW
ncbi:transcription factor IIA subunit alpha [Coemansia sp. RSA 1813]|nr:transcription factor IIA subunit alpha [Coemansia sp. RSA 1646]KAJ1768536.1 transcription factor IIA subunit alpha [Coemansia sp. RSA 1843]KAJ2086620.1 transcription factor IIA subunit alpha [Coemansia sp. RSA 986]KAJ2212499.1 transcription factor IIA subunit alpha [Coemansia sp. RSA 487]KAJ2565037.1 transcription factor IIA subunit alpha [Coemansia sp. RSA 1813]